MMVVLLLPPIFEMKAVYPPHRGMSRDGICFACEQLDTLGCHTAFMRQKCAGRKPLCPKPRVFP